MATTLTSSAFIAYPIHAVPLNMSRGKRKWLINNAYKIIFFLAVSIYDFNIEEDEIVDNTLDQDSDC